MIWTLPSIMTSSFGSASASSLLTGLVSYWNLDESSGNAIDLVGSNTGTLVGSTTQGTTGKINTCYGFPNNSAVNFGHDASLDLVQKGSVSCWIYITTQGYSVIFQKSDLDNSQNGWALTTTLDDGICTLQAFVANSSTSHYWGGGTGYTNLNTGTWYHVVMTWDNDLNDLSVYLNGNLEISSIKDIDFTSSGFDFVLGAIKWTGGYYNYFKGNIDEVGVWNRALTGTEVTTLYSGGSGKSYPF